MHCQECFEGRNHKILLSISESLSLPSILHKIMEVFLKDILHFEICVMVCRQSSMLLLEKQRGDVEVFLLN